jgi:RNA polymerase sigma factor (sigma-70 family)
MLSKLTPRQRTILKLRLGCLPLNNVELGKVLAEKRAQAVEVRRRSLQEVAALIGVSQERIRQIENRSLEKLGLA